MAQQDARQDAGNGGPDETTTAKYADNRASGQTDNTVQRVSSADLGAGQMCSAELGPLGTSGDMSNQDDVAGFGAKGAGGLHGVSPAWQGTPLARAEEQAEQGGNPPATTPVTQQGTPSSASQAADANRNDWQVSAGEAAAADRESATGAEPRGSFGPVGGSESISASPGAANPDK